MSQAKSAYQVLVIDDSPVYRKLVEQILSCDTYSLLFARDGEEALRLFHEHSPSIVITDWILPDFSGIELCQRIRSDNSRPYTYVILMTGNTEKGNLVKALEAGADDYVLKPFDDGEMLARVGVGRRIIDLNRELDAKSKKMEEAARTDHLTGLPNRRAIEEWTSRQLRGSARHGFPVWIAIADLDNFKSVNDTFGHDAGDVVLCAFADLLKKHMRAADMSARLGGDEFVLVFTHVEPAHIEATADRFRQMFAALSFDFQGQTISCTASFGVSGTTCHEPREYNAVLRKADQLLYEAKHAGRNCIRICYPQ
jgi:two-component system, cell cycle response regulator